MLKSLPHLRQDLPLNQLGPSARSPADRHHRSEESVATSSTPLRPRSVQLSETPGRASKTADIIHTCTSLKRVGMRLPRSTRRSYESGAEEDPELFSND